MTGMIEKQIAQMQVADTMAIRQHPVDAMAEQQGLAQAAAQRQGANAVLGATTMDPDWEAQLAKQERGFTRANALEKAMQSFIQGDHPSAEDIVARAKVFETYLLGDQS